MNAQASLAKVFAPDGAVIRIASSSDYPVIVKMISHFHAEAGAGYCKWDRQSMLRTLQSIAKTGVILLAVAEPNSILGVIAGVKYPVFCNYSQLMVQESFLWVEPQYRKHGIAQRLINALEAWAVIKGARSVTMVSYDASGSDPGPLYSAMDYAPFERHWIKFLDGRKLP